MEKIIAIQWKYVQSTSYDDSPFVGKYMQIEETRKILQKESKNR